MYKIDFIDGVALRWSVNGELETDREYTSRLYVTGDETDLAGLTDQMRDWTPVNETSFVERRPRWRDQPDQVLQVQVRSPAAVTGVARKIAHTGTPGQFQLYNVDLSPQFRYCLETGQSPAPTDELTRYELTLPEPSIANSTLDGLTINGQATDGAPAAVLNRIYRELQSQDPDIIEVSHAQLIPLLYTTADQYGVDRFELGRMPGYSQLAQASTYTQYGKREHSPARYNVPGRAIIDHSNSFFLSETNLEGLLDLAERSWKPVQEAAWASIGNLLTAIQIREAHRNDVLIPWRSWEPEMPKTARTLHDSDRGGFTFSPEVGVHRNVYEADFASLYPNIMVTRNVSPDVINCACHSDRSDVPGLPYNLCEQDGYLGRVLKPLIEDREDMKHRLREDDLDAETRQELEGRVDAIKWVLVSCFGYQGFSNSKFGRIECHEAINAFAREIMLQAKQVFEDAGYRVLHGIVDSIWVTPRVDDPEPITDVCAHITDQVDIRLDYEGHFDWIGFCSRRNDAAGALTRYFGRRSDGSYKVRGIELRQRTTPPFIAEAQEAMLEALHPSLGPEPVRTVYRRYRDRLADRAIDPRELVVTQRVSKQPDQYQHRTRAVNAMERAQHHGRTINPGQSLEYIVVNDERDDIDRVRFPYEDDPDYDPAFYIEELERAAASVLNPLDAPVTPDGQPTLSAYIG